MDGYILVADDEAHIRRILTLQLTHAGFDVETVVDGQEALDLIRDRLPLLVITDFQMPRVDGLELCEVIRSDPEYSDIPVLFLTAKGFELDEETISNRLGLAAVLCKPFSPDELLDAVERTLKGARLA